MKNGSGCRHIWTTGATGCWALFIATVLFGCASNVPAPVVERGQSARSPVVTTSVPTTPPQPLEPGMYRVKKGDTLYAIALDHGQSYRDLAAWNSLTDPNRIEIDQVLRVYPPGETPAVNDDQAVATAQPVHLGTAPLAVAGDAVNHTPVTADQALKRGPKGGKRPYSPEALAALQAEAVAAATPSTSATPSSPAAPPSPIPAAAPAPAAATSPAKPPAATTDSVDWGWPVPGKVIAGFNEANNKGLDIAGRMGEPVLAAAAGKVILVSSALRGYGNFVIVKHNKSFLSVYAHNSRILVKEEQAVKKGQKIAEIGNSDADQTKLHFEIRQQGKPVDPAQFLPAR